MSTVPTFLLWNRIAQYQPKIDDIVKSFDLTDRAKVVHISRLPDQYNNYTLDDLFTNTMAIRPNAICRREEHGCFYYMIEDKWKDYIARCDDNNIKYLTYDFGYFNHYDSYMVDMPNRNNKSSIYTDWGNLSDTVDWSLALPFIQNYRNDFLKRYEQASNTEPINNLPRNEYVVIWPQQDAIFLRSSFQEKDYMERGITDWIIRICKEVRKLGLVPVLKITPMIADRKQFKFEEISQHVDIYFNTPGISAKKKYPTIKYDDNINTRLLAHCAFNVIGCSSSSNEMVLANKPVIATGKSWFNNLNIFSEPDHWDNLFKDCMQINQPMRNKWINWWLSRQCLKVDLPNKMAEVYNNFSSSSNK